jgi:hypothetical protein
MEWWHLPGPARFVSSIVQDLREGRNVVVWLPNHHPRGIGKSIRHEWNEESRWVTLQVQEATDKSPIDQVYERFSYTKFDSDLRLPRKLISNRDFLGHLIWLEGIPPRSWAQWRSFLQDYEPACRTCSFLDRTVFCVAVAGRPTCDQPREDACLTVRRAEGISGTMDMLLYVAQFVDSTRFSGELRASVVAHIALWDPELAKGLARLPVGRILEPEEFLYEFAREREWVDQEYATGGLSWEKGTLGMIDGRVLAHSAVLHSEDGRRELQRRIWRGQVAVLFPYIEEQRHIILDRCAEWLRVPFTTRFGQTISDIRDLEIGHLEAQLSCASNKTARDLAGSLTTLRRIRNHLAHLEPVPPELLDQL